MRYDNVWDAIEEPGEAEHMKARSEVMIAVTEQIRRLELTPGQAAEQLRVKRSRIYELQAGRINLFSLDKLIDYAALLGLHPRIQLDDRAA